jgi:hypothetical protein
MNGVRWTRQSVPFQRSASTDPPRLVETDPTAVQVEGAEHDTPESPIAPAGLGAGWTVQLVPFQRSVRTPEAVLPAPVQAEAEVHEMAPRLSPAVAEVGFCWMLHFDPFQRSVIVPTGLPEPSPPWPTAAQAKDDVHETPVRNPDCIPAGVGTGWVFQRVPFQRSARSPAVVPPTAVQAEAEEHETA